MWKKLLKLLKNINIKKGETQDDNKMKNLIDSKNKKDDGFTFNIFKKKF